MWKFSEIIYMDSDAENQIKIGYPLTYLDF